MRARITRSGGFAGISTTHEVELSPTQLTELRARGGSGLQLGPDAFTYEVALNGETFNVTDSDLMEQLLRGRAKGETRNVEC